MQRLSDSESSFSKVQDLSIFLSLFADIQKPSSTFSALSRILKPQLAFISCHMEHRQDLFSSLAPCSKGKQRQSPKTVLRVFVLSTLWAPWSCLLGDSSLMTSFQITSFKPWLLNLLKSKIVLRKCLSHYLIEFIKSPKVELYAHISDSVCLWWNLKLWTSNNSWGDHWGWSLSGGRNEWMNICFCFGLQKEDYHAACFLRFTL